MYRLQGIRPEVNTPKILVLDRTDELSEQLRTVVDDMRPRPDIAICNRIGAVGEVLEDEGPFDVLVAGPSLGTRSGLARLEVIRQELPGMSLILAFSRRPEASLRDIVRAGAVDVLQLPADDEDLQLSLERALDIRRRLPSEARPAPVVQPALPIPEGPAKIFTVSSATGGCGKTFYATNLAYFLAHHTGKRVCIVDLDLQFGEISTALRLRPRYTIYDVLNRDDTAEEDLLTHIEEYLVMHETGVHVLAAPKDPAEADRISPPDVTRIVEAIRDRFDYVIIDTPAQLSEIVLAAFDLSEVLYSMATLDLPSVRNMSVFLATLEKLKIPADGIKLILNKAESDVGIDVAQIEKLFPQGFMSILPYAKEVSRSINLGVPVMASSPTSDISRRMAAGMTDLLPEVDRRKIEVPAPIVRQSFLKKMFNRPKAATG
jgi:pilus assembly protein CpaE